MDLGNVAGDRVYAALGPIGFRRKRLTFVATRGECELLISLQKSMYSRPGTLKFTCNLGVYWLPLASAAGQPKEVASVERCHWRTRIGRYTPDFDKWWTAESADEAERAAEEVVALLFNSGIPDLEAMCEPSRLGRLLGDNKLGGVKHLDRSLYAHLVR